MNVNQTQNLCHATAILFTLGLLMGLLTACATAAEIDETLTTARQLAVLMSDPESAQRAAAASSSPEESAPGPTATPTPPYILGYHEVQPGDTLWAIAARYDIPVELLQAVNELEEPDHLSLGQRLLISERVTVSGALIPTPTPTPIPCYDGCLYREFDCQIKGVVARLDGTPMYVMPGDEIYPLTVAEVWFCREEDAQREGWLRWTPFGPAR